MTKIFSPWTLEEVDNLNARQALQCLHPYTCGKCQKTLVACFSGWQCPDFGCDYKQNWAHEKDVTGETLRDMEEKI